MTKWTTYKPIGNWFVADWPIYIIQQITSQSELAIDQPMTNLKTY